MKEILLAVMAMLNFGCADLFSQYGMRMVESPSGEKLYFRREARGLNFDSLVLTKNPDHCREPDPSHDIVFFGLGPIHVFYKFEENRLHLYLTNLVDVPDKFSDKTQIVQHKLSNPEFIFMKENYKTDGLGLIDVPLDKALTCEE